METRRKRPRQPIHRQQSITKYARAHITSAIVSVHDDIGPPPTLLRQNHHGFLLATTNDHATSSPLLPVFPNASAPISSTPPSSPCSFLSTHLFVDHP